MPGACVRMLYVARPTGHGLYDGRFPKTGIDLRCFLTSEYMFIKFKQEFEEMMCKQTRYVYLAAVSLIGILVN